MNVELIYQRLCREADPKGALAKLGNLTLAMLLADLRSGGIETGFPGMMLLLCEAEAARRWVDEHVPTPGAVGEG